MRSDAGEHRLNLPPPTSIPSTDDVDLAIYDFGDDSTDRPGGDVLLVHATGFCAGVWLPVVEQLREFRCAALDVRGHGVSSVGDAPVDWSRSADDVLATIDELGLDRPFGVGHSMGGAILTLAEIARPGTFSGLWLFEPIIFPAELSQPGDVSGNPLAIGARRRRPGFASAADAYANYASKPPLSALHPDALDAYVRYGFAEQPDGSVTLRCAPETEAANFEVGATHRAYEHLGEIACPVTVARGAVDDFGPAMLAPAVAEQIPTSRLEEHPELGHFGPMEDPAGVAAAVRSAVTAGS